MSARAKVDAFEAWLRAAGTAEEIAYFNRSTADGFVAVAGAGKVTAAHVELSCKLARDAGMDVTAMERLGALFVRYGESAVAEPIAPPARAPAPAVVEAKAPSVEELMAELMAAAAAAPVHEPEPITVAPEPDAIAADPIAADPIAAEPIAAEPIAADPEPAEPAPARLNVSFRASTQIPPLAKVVDEPEPPPARRARPPIRRAQLIALGAVVAIGGVVAWRASGSAPAVAPTNPQRLAQLDLDAELPADWHIAPAAAASSALGAVKTSMVSHGGTADDPDDRAFLATLPLTDALAAGTDITDDALVHAAHVAELGTASRLAADGGTYQSGGCAVAALPGRTAVCRGTVHEAGQVLALQTYLRVGESRALVALFVAKLSVADPAREADAIVGGIGL